MRRMFVTCIATLAAIACHGRTSVFASSPEKPNVVIFYADDLGWGETGAFGSQDIPTPNIDSLANNGVKFTQGYVAATYCSPSRAGLLTGKYPTRFGHEFNSVARVAGLKLDQSTLADRLKSLGYSTIAIGKWHLGNGPEYRPTKRGFEQFYGTLANTPYYHPTNFVDSRQSDEVQPIKDESFYTTDAYAKRAVEWLEENKDSAKFLYLPFNAQHAPLQVPEKYLARFSNIQDEKRKSFAAILSATDDAIGSVIAKIRSLGQEDNTIYFYIGDNGGPTRSTTSNNGGLRGFKSTTYEGGPRVPFIVQWTAKLPKAKVYDNPVLNLDVLPTVVSAAGGAIEETEKLDGVDLVPYLTGAKSERPHESLFWRFGRQWAVRHGDYKLVVSNGGSGQPELYNLAQDHAESQDLAESQPEKVKELTAIYETWNKQQAEPSVPNDPPKNANAKNNKQGNKKGNAQRKKQAVN